MNMGKKICRGRGRIKKKRRRKRRGGRTKKTMGEEEEEKRRRGHLNISVVMSSQAPVVGFLKGLTLFCIGSYVK